MASLGCCKADFGTQYVLQWALFLQNRLTRAYAAEPKTTEPLRVGFQKETLNPKKKGQGGAQLSARGWEVNV